jgi:hypothetical protein
MFITILAYIKTLSIIVVFFFYINLLRPLTAATRYSLIRQIRLRHQAAPTDLHILEKERKITRR